MLVTIPLHASQIQGGLEDIRKVYQERYTGEIGFYSDADGDGKTGFLSAAAYSGKDCMRISVHGNDERILLTATYDNLGKGASGAAIECMNIALGFPKNTGLEL